MISLPLQGVGAAGASAQDTSRSPQAPASTADAATPLSGPSASSPVSPVLTAAASAQGGLAPLLADLVAAVSTPGLPAPVRAAADQVLGFGMDENQAPTGDDLQALLARSGLFLETQLSEGLAPAGDFKAMLLDLSAALETWAGDERSPAASARQPPPPPFGGGPVRGQAAVAASVGPDTPSGVLAAKLLSETQAALSRQVLMQSASAGEPAKANGDDQPVARWLFELPVAGQDGRSVAQFEIARDGRRRSDQDTDRTWRTRFSLDLEGLGAVHATLSLTGARLHVSLWAQDAATEADLADHQSQLRAELQDDGLSAEVSVRSGAPPTPPTSSGRFMDVAA